MIWFISDTHFNHDREFIWGPRGFKNINESNKTIIDNWNKTIGPNDDVYILGDFFLGKDIDFVKETLKILHGKIHLIIGNHDYFINDNEIRKQFVQIKDRKTIKDGKERIILDHHPSLFWDGQFRNTVHFYAHVHNSHQENMIRSWLTEARQLQDIPMRAYNVGCMMPWINYIPRTAEYILAEAPKYLNTPAFGSEKHETIT